MKNKVILLIFVSSLFMSFYNDKYERKITRQIKKIFHTEEFQREYLKIDGLKSESSTEVFLIKKKDEKIGYFSVTEATGCSASGCTNNIESNEFEVFFMLMIFDIDAKIQKVKILEYDSEFGYEVMSPGWLRQFEKNKKQKLIYDQDIDGITGATKSGLSVTHEVNVVSKYVRQINR